MSPATMASGAWVVPTAFDDVADVPADVMVAAVAPRVVGVAVVAVDAHAPSTTTRPVAPRSFARVGEVFMRCPSDGGSCLGRYEAVREWTGVGTQTEGKTGSAAVG